MDLGICILTSVRPNYLYVTLESLHQVYDIKKYPVYIYCDKPPVSSYLGIDDSQPPAEQIEILEAKIRYDITETIAHFSVESIYYASEWMNIGKSHMQALKIAFNNGHDAVLLIEDDVIVRPDSIKYLVDISQNIEAHFYSLFKIADDLLLYGTYASSFSIMYTKAAWEIIDRSMRTKEYLGMMWSSSDKKFGDVPDAFQITFDRIAGAIAQRYNTLLVCPEKSYSAHIGVIPTKAIRINGSNYVPSSTHPDYDYEVVLEFEDNIYNQDRENWMLTIIEIMQRGQYSPKLDGGLFPRFFSYNGISGE